ncbi:Nn.00g031110.m01.CDS01 [Neocucurbitaria sp. VM-36]
MSSHQSTQPFRFLDLPGEIRNNIYDLLLCSWNNELEEDPSLISNLSKRCPSYSAAALLCTNKQIQCEAADYMTKRNQFVRITCRGLDARNLFLSDGIPVITTNSRKVNQYQGYVMHMTLSKPAFSPSAFQFSEFEIMMLRADLPYLCERLDIESVMADMNSRADEHASIHAEVKLNYAYSRFFTPKIQEHLLNPIGTFLRGLPNLRVLGPVDPALATAVIDEVAKPRWTEPASTLEEIGTGVDVGKRQWQQNSYYTASESWAYAMRTLERMRHSSSWLGLQETGGEDFVNKTADLYFTLNLFHAQFLQVDMSGDHAIEPLVQRNGIIALQHLRKCETASARFAQHAGATWAPSNQQSAKMLFRHARCLRLMHDSANRVKAVTLIEEAATLSPNDLAIRDEKDAVLSWNAGIEEAQRLLEHEAEEAEIQKSSLWSSVWTIISELAA